MAEDARCDMSNFFTTESVLKRFFFVAGNTKDSFCSSDLAQTDLEFALYKELKANGYERIVFYSKKQKLYCFDQESYRLVLDPATVTSKKQKSKLLMKGPLKGHLLGNDDNTVPHDSGAKEMKLHFSKMTELDAFERIDWCMRDEKHKTAFVFTNAEDFIFFFGEVRTDRGSEDVRSRIYDSMTSYDGLGFRNSNIILFVFPQRTMSEIDESYTRLNNLCWNNFFAPRLKETPKNVIEIECPASGEIRNAINLLRINDGLKCDFNELDSVCDFLARKAISNHLTLTSILSYLLEIARSNDILNIAKCEEVLGLKAKESAMKRLNGLIGMAEVKKHITAFVKRAEKSKVSIEHSYMSRLAPQKQNVNPNINLHFVITGNPGTGKTTVAKLLGEILYELGYLPSGHTVKVTRADLVGEYVGQTAVKTRKKIEEAKGGVLFIDEAYMLKRQSSNGAADNDFGQEAIDTILEAMTDMAGTFSVIAAGYPKEMQAFINSNPGLERRFKDIINIEDYKPDELLEIFNMMCKQRQCMPDEALSTKLPGFFESWYRSRDEKWGNAGNVEKLIDKMYDNWCIRDDSSTMDGCSVLTAADVPENLYTYLASGEKQTEDALTKLNNLIGLSEVKKQIARIRRTFKVSGRVIPGHYVFAGNPGTGKTTVARLFGQILRETGVLERGHVVEVQREDLVAGFVGQTAIKTREIIDKALDGILFIDEAYRLSGGSGENDYGKEAIDTLVAQMENNRNRLCVICAGYSAPMEAFIRSNPGLKSRFTNTITFEDYNAVEMLKIIEQFAGNDFKLEEDYLRRCLVIFDSWCKNRKSDFGNGRDVRKFYEECQACLYERLENQYALENIPEEEKHRLTAADIPAEYERLLFSEPAKKQESEECVRFVPLAKDKVHTREKTNAFVFDEHLDKLAEGLILISIETESGAKGHGSGFLVTSDGYAITCNHVIRDAAAIEVRLNIPGRIGGDITKHKAVVVKSDPTIDIALIKIEGANFPCMSMELPDQEIKAGHEIALLGYPFGTRLSDDIDKLNYSVFKGFIASVQEKNNLQQVFVNMEAKQGNSGGPVIDRESGNVIGVLCGSVTKSGDQINEEINYIRPIKYVWQEYIDSSDSN